MVDNKIVNPIDDKFYKDMLNAVNIIDEFWNVVKDLIKPIIEAYERYSSLNFREKTKIYANKNYKT